MKALVPLSLGMALAATLGLAYFVMRETGTPAPPPVRPATTPSTSATEPAEIRRLRPYQTTQTLTEDLRDALAANNPIELGREVRRVSTALRRRATWMLENIAPFEASPNVRALLVLANGVHIPDSNLLLGFLTDPAPPVRRAAGLAAAYATDAAQSVTLMPGVDCPVGRTLPDRTAAVLRRHATNETDKATRRALARAVAATADVSAK